MMTALWTSATGMSAQQAYIDVIANNLANVNTTSFKKSQIEFQDLLYQTERIAGSPNSAGTTPVGIQIGLGVRTASVSKVFTQGGLKNTGNALDLAIEGEGFFKVIDSCKGKVELVTGEGDRLNLKSKLSQYVSMANIFSNGEIPELEIIAYEKEDTDRLIQYMMEGAE